MISGGIIASRVGGNGNQKVVKYLELNVKVQVAYGRNLYNDALFIDKIF